MDEACIFCKIIKGEVPAQKEYEDEQVLAFRDMKPSAPVHILIVPKKHIARLADTTQADLELLGKCQLVAVDLAMKFGIQDAFKLAVNSGKNAGQVVFHLHYHLHGGWSQPVSGDNLA